MDQEWFAWRLFNLRIAKNISARDMSLSLGQSESYINKIENQKALPSMNMFFYMCEFLGVTPSEFFDEDLEKSKKINDLNGALQKLSPVQLDALKNLIDAFDKNKRTQ